MTTLRIVPDGSTLVSVVEEEVSDLRMLHAISMDLIGEQDLTALYGKIVDAAVSITRSQFGTMQVLRRADETGEAGLELLVSRGLAPRDRAVWEWVSPSAHSSCTAALKTGQRAIIADFEEWGEIAGTGDLLAFRRAGIRSAQTTPLRSRDGTLLGMISTHWAKPHEPSERDLYLLDILARQAADILDRTIREDALRERERELQETVAVLRATEAQQRVLTGELAHRVKNLFAMVTAITSHSMRGSNDQQRVQNLQQRLFALSSAHDLLLQANWQSAMLGEVASAAVNGAGVLGRVHLDGPDVAMGSKAALSLALLLHELTTNALKYGSLSLGAGRVDLGWRVEGDVLRVTWRESRGPEVVVPSGAGFGSRLINAGLGGSGGVVVAYNRSGLVCEISAPLSELSGDEG